MVPVLYAGQDLTCALGATVFHDLDDDPAVAQEVLRADLLTLRAGTLTLKRDVLVADLRDEALPAYGVTRAQWVSTAPTDYPTTGLWGQLAWDAGLDGVVWNSRRSPTWRAFAFFLPAVGSRRVLRRRDVDAVAPPVPLFDGPGLGHVMSAASARNVTVVIP